MSCFEQVIQILNKEGWTIRGVKEKKYEIPQIYRGKIFEFEDIANKYDVIVNPDDTVWFVIGEHLKCDADVALKNKILGGYEDTESGLTASDIINSSEKLPFLWDTFKNISIGASEDNGVTEQKWWDKHFPFIMSVKDGYYEFYSVNVDDGSIEYGTEPMFEDTETVAASFEDFWNKIISEKIEL